MVLLWFFLVSLILFLFCCVKQEGRAGYTPLHIAVEQQNFELTTFLLEHCKTVNTEQMCYRKITAYQLASELDHIEIMDILKKCGCKVISSSYDSDYEDSDESDVADSDWILSSKQLLDGIQSSTHRVTHKH